VKGGRERRRPSKKKRRGENGSSCPGKKEERFYLGKKTCTFEKKGGSPFLSGNQVHHLTKKKHGKKSLIFEGKGKGFFG